MNIKKIKPMYTRIVVTMDKYGADEVSKDLIIDPSKQQGSVKEIQKVICVGTAVRDIKEGDYVSIDPRRYAVHKHQENSARRDILGDTIVGYNIPQVELDGQKYFMIDQQDVEYVVEEWEEEKQESPIINVQPQIIIP